MALPAVAHERGAGHGERRFARPGPYHRRGLDPHAVEERVYRFRVEVLDPQVVTAYHLVGHRSGQEPDRGPRPRLRRDDDLAHPHLLRHPGRVQRAVPAEGDHHAVLQALALLRRVHARRVGHGLVDHLRDAVGPRRNAGAKPRSDVALDSAAGEVEVEPQAPLGEGVGVEIAGHRIGIGHRRPFAAAPVAGGPGVGGCAARSDPQPGQLVHARDGAAPGPDLDHLQHRDPHRQTAALDEPFGPSDLERPRGARLAVLDETHLRRRPSHVERQHVGAPARARDSGGEDRAPARSRLDQPYRERQSGVQRRHAAAGGHQQQRAVEPVAFEAEREVLEVACHQRLDVGVGHRRAQPVELPDLRGHLARETHRNPGRPALDGVAHGPLVDGVCAGMQQAHGDALDAVRHQIADGAMHAVAVQRDEHPSGRGEPLRDGHDPLSRDDGVGLLEIEVVLVVAPLVGDLEDVPEPLRDDGADGGAPALNQGVGRECGPVNDRADVPRRQPGSRERQPGSVEHPLHRVARSGEDLAGAAGAVDLDRHVGERAADVHRESGSDHAAISLAGRRIHVDPATSPRSATTAGARPRRWRRAASLSTGMARPLAVQPRRA